MSCGVLHLKGVPMVPIVPGCVGLFTAGGFVGYCKDSERSKTK